MAFSSTVTFCQTAVIKSSLVTRAPSASARTDKIASALGFTGMGRPQSTSWRNGSSVNRPTLYSVLCMLMLFDAPAPRADGGKRFFVGYIVKLLKIQEIQKKISI